MTAISQKTRIRFIIILLPQFGPRGGRSSCFDRYHQPGPIRTHFINGGSGLDYSWTLAVSRALREYFASQPGPPLRGRLVVRNHLGD
jgi:hypothetical protein